MPERPRDDEAELRAIMEALAESVAEASDEEILRETREAAEDPRVIADRVRDVLRRAAKDFEQRRLRVAEKAHEEHVQSLRTRSSRSEERRVGKEGRSGRVLGCRKSTCI